MLSVGRDGIACCSGLISDPPGHHQAILDDVECCSHIRTSASVLTIAS